MRILDEEFMSMVREKCSIGKKGFRRGFGPVMGFLTNQFDERIIEKFLERGDIKFLILNALGKKSMHGYQIISDIEGDFQGLYTPSPGAVYPTLQMLEEAGLISMSEKESKKVYSLTKNGKAELKNNELRVNNILSRVSEHKEKHWFGRELRGISSKFMSLGSEIFVNAKKNFSTDSENVEGKLVEVSKVLDKAREDVVKIWSS
ncbi:MAG: PadR family transcriptional regulator [Nanoarchaeota archaeon]|nr:PadR family transcriptional regulator [Nanoarchaeota archaeon]